MGQVCGAVKMVQPGPFLPVHPVACHGAALPVTAWVLVNVEDEFFHGVYS